MKYAYAQIIRTNDSREQRETYINFCFVSPTLSTPENLKPAKKMKFKVRSRKDKSISSNCLVLLYLVVSKQKS